ncbi:B12-binding domain-containing radical SAM protein [Magnetococcales bacterium HHB-1]
MASKILFVIADSFFSEPLGVMALSASCKQKGHQTYLTILRKHDFEKALTRFQPDVIAYSVMTSNAGLFHQADEIAKVWIKQQKASTIRVMGGAHPTYFPEVLDQFSLDALCIGEGDRALPRLIEAFEEGRSFDGIPNLITPTHREHIKELVDDLDELPFADRDLLYEADPELIHIGIRSFLTQKGCPYKCTYCFNHAYNMMFKGGGRKLFRRRSVDHLLLEIKQVKAKYPTMRMVRFADDVFVMSRRNAWLEEFAERYPKEVGIPFYCLIRSNSLTEDVAQLLAKAGCRSISMSIEAGESRVRNEVLKRNMPDEMMHQSFSLARNYESPAKSLDLRNVVQCQDDRVMI